MFHSALVAASWISLLLTVIPLSRSSLWWIRCWEFPRLQLFALGLVCLALWLQRLLSTGALADSWWHDAAMVVALAVALTHQSLFILPYTVFAAKDAPDSRPSAGGPHANSSANDLRLVVVNVLMTNQQYSTLADDFARLEPDMVLALEVDGQWCDTLDRLLPAERYPHRVVRPQSNYYGMALYSRLELEEPRILFLVQNQVPSVHTHVVLRDGQRVLFVGLHPQPPSPTGDDRSVERDAELLMVARQLRYVQEPIVVAGDLNDVAWSRSTGLFMRVSALCDPRRGRGFFNSFNAKIPLIMRWSLDHVFHSRHFTVTQLRLLRFFGSDHFPVYVHLRLEQRDPHRQGAGSAAPDKATAAAVTRKLTHVAERIENGCTEPPVPAAAAPPQRTAHNCDSPQRHVAHPSRWLYPLHAVDSEPLACTKEDLETVAAVLAEAEQRRGVAKPPPVLARRRRFRGVRSSVRDGVLRWLGG